MCRLITGPLPGPGRLHIAQPSALPAQEGREPRRDLEGPGKTDGVPRWTSVTHSSTLSSKLPLDPILAVCLLRFLVRAWEAPETG